VTRSRVQAGVRLLALAAGTVSCATTPAGSFVWVEDYKPRAGAAAGSDTIRPGDVLDVRVLGQEQLSAKVRVRADGQVTLPFLNDIQADGQTPDALKSVVEQKLKTYVNLPVVTVGVDKATPSPLSFLGEVARPGKYPFEPGMGLLDAVALAGGLTEYAHKDRLYVLRGQSKPIRIRFDVRLLLRGEGRGPAFLLEPGDILVAE
jgi:polysaccharide biosynthesis/export protein